MLFTGYDPSQLEAQIVEYMIAQGYWTEEMQTEAGQLFLRLMANLIGNHNYNVNRIYEESFEETARRVDTIIESLHKKGFDFYKFMAAQGAQYRLAKLGSTFSATGLKVSNIHAMGALGGNHGSIIARCQMKWRGYVGAFFRISDLVENETWRRILNDVLYVQPSKADFVLFLVPVNCVCQVSGSAVADPGGGTPTIYVTETVNLFPQIISPEALDLNDIFAMAKFEDVDVTVSSLNQNIVIAKLLNIYNIEQISSALEVPLRNNKYQDLDTPKMYASLTDDGQFAVVNDQYPIGETFRVSVQRGTAQSGLESVQIDLKDLIPVSTGWSEQKGMLYIPEEVRVVYSASAVLATLRAEPWHDVSIPYPPAGTWADWEVESESQDLQNWERTYRWKHSTLDGWSWSARARGEWNIKFWEYYTYFDPISHTTFTGEWEAYLYLVAYGIPCFGPAHLNSQKVNLGNGDRSMVQLRTEPIPILDGDSASFYYSLRPTFDRSNTLYGDLNTVAGLRAFLKDKLYTNGSLVSPSDITAATLQIPQIIAARAYEESGNKLVFYPSSLITQTAVAALIADSGQAYSMVDPVFRELVLKGTVYHDSSFDQAAFEVIFTRLRAFFGETATFSDLINTIRGADESFIDLTGHFSIGFLQEPTNIVHTVSVSGGQDIDFFELYFPGQPTWGIVVTDTVGTVATANFQCIYTVDKSTGTVALTVTFFSQLEDFYVLLARNNSSIQPKNDEYVQGSKLFVTYAG